MIVRPSTRDWLRIRQRFALAATLLALSLLVVSCGEEEGPGGTGSDIVRVSIDPASGEVGGSPINVTVTGILGNGKPMGAGTALLVFTTSGIDQGVEPIGWFGSGEATEDNRKMGSATITGITGSAQLPFNCEKEGTTEILATNASQSAIGRAMVTCVPGPDGTWSITSVTRTMGELRTGNNTITLQAAAIDGNGDPVEAGINITFTIESGSSLTFERGGDSVTSRTNAEGLASAQLKTGSVDGDTSIRVDFGNPAYGEGVLETYRVRPEGGGETVTIDLVVEKGGEVLEPSDQAVLADGEDFVTLEATVVLPSNLDVEVENLDITFEVESGPGFLREDAEDRRRAEELIVSTDDNGTAVAQFLGGDEAGGTIIKVTMDNPDLESSMLTVETETLIAVTALGFVDYDGVSPSVMFVRGGGQTESATVTFKVLDTNRNVLTNVPVSFELVNAPTGTQASPLMARSGEDGKVTTTLQSGQTVGTATVRATATIGESTLEAVSSPVPVVGARPSRSGYTFQCDHRNFGGLIGRVGNQVVVDSEFSCRSTLIDRFGNPVGAPDQSVSFKSEGGAINSPATAVEWDTESNPDAPPQNVGFVSTRYKPLGEPPCDVDDISGEPWYETSGNCDVVNVNCAEREDTGGVCRFNPRDGLSTLVAITKGEEAFTDTNDNGEYDLGEPFWDIGEPLVDSNDNNRYDEGEEFGDSNQNGMYDGPNGQWDAVTDIWAVTHVLLTGEPVVANAGRVDDGEPNDSAVGFAYISDPTLAYNGTDPTNTLTLWWVDNNLNYLNGSATYTVEFAAGQGDNLSLDELISVEGDAYGHGFILGYNQEVIGPGINTYVTDIDFAESYTGTRVTARFEPTDIPYDDSPILDFKVVMGIAPGVGENLTRIHSVPVRVP